MDNDRFSRDNDTNINFFIRLLWCLSGADVKTLKKAETYQSQYTFIGFGIFLIAILGMVSGGYLIYSSIKIENKLVKWVASIVGGVLIGTTMGFIDASVLSGIDKPKKRKFIKTAILGVFATAKIGISVIVSTSVSLPLQMLFFEPDIKEEIAQDNDAKINTIKSNIETEYEEEIDNAEEAIIVAQNNLDQQRKLLITQQEILQTEASPGRGGYGSQSEKIQQTVNNLQAVVEQKGRELGNAQTSLKTIREEIKQKANERKIDLDSSDGFLTRLKAFYKIAKEDDKENPMLVLQIPGYDVPEIKAIQIGSVSFFTLAITLLLIAADNAGIINKLIGERSKYDELLDKEREEEKQYVVNQIENDYKIKEKFATDIIEQEYFNQIDIAKQELSEEKDIIAQQLDNKRKFRDAYKANQEKELNAKINDYLSNPENRNETDRMFREYLEYLNSLYFFNKDNTLKKNTSKDNSNSANTSDKTKSETFYETKKKKIARTQKVRDSRNNISKKHYASMSRTPETEGFVALKTKVEAKTKKIKNNINNSIADIHQNINTGFDFKKLKHQRKSLPLFVTIVLRGSIYSMSGILSLLTVIFGFEAIAISDIKVVPIPFPSIANPNLIYANNGQLIRTPHSEKVALEELKIDDFSPYLKKALIASEDRYFEKHGGVDYRGIARAIVYRGKRGGGSGITMQIAGEYYIKPDYQRKSSSKSLSLFDELRIKVREIIFSYRIEGKLDKDEILSVYLNFAYLGGDNYNRNIVGFENAAQFYFSKSAKNLNISEAATLVKMLTQPNKLDPTKNKEEITKERNIGIDQMLEQEQITKEEAFLAKQIDVIPNINNQKKTEEAKVYAPFLYSKVELELKRTLQNYREQKLSKYNSYIIETTLNPKYQQEAEKALSSYMRDKAFQYDHDKGAIVTIDNNTGAILAYASYPEYKKSISEYDHVSIARTPLASTFKLATYAAAIEAGIPSNKEILCVPLETNIRTNSQSLPCPKDRTKEKMTIAESFAKSENTVALQIAKDIGEREVENLSKNMQLGIDFEKKKKIDTNKNNYLNKLVLGSYESTLLKITNAYSLMSNKGRINAPYTIKTILNRNTCEDRSNIKTCQNPIHTYDGSGEKPNVVSPKTASVMIEIMEGVVNNDAGTAHREIKKTEPKFITDIYTVGKTGTGEGGKNIWFIGIVPKYNITTGIWTGKKQCTDDPKTNTSCETNIKEANSSLAVALWANYMGNIIE